MWLFRDPSRLIQYIVLIYSVLLSFTIYKIITIEKINLKWIKIVIISIIAISILFSASTYTFINNGGGRLISSQIPKEYYEVYTFLKNEEGYFKVLWLPLGSYYNYEWNEIREEVAGNFYLVSTPKPTYGHTSVYNEGSKFWKDLYVKLLSNYEFNELSYFLNLKNIKYIIVFTDLLGWKKAEAKSLMEVLYFQKDIKFVRQVGPYYLFENLKYGNSTRQFSLIYFDGYENSLNIYKLNFEVNFLAIVNYSKINPTLWKVQVNASKPFMLSFAESYDPLWEARVYKDGKLVEKVKSLPLYGVINGFWINTTGENLEIVIRYTPQDWFEMGLVISGITFAFCIFYLIYDWRKGKGDIWTKRLERSINEKMRNLKLLRKMHNF
ncbi:MAG: hypothetical protein QW038_02340 [Nanopusillaceae archaeon]